eukprot:c40398_g1_i1 orf=26-250(-)
MFYFIFLPEMPQRISLQEINELYKTNSYAHMHMLIFYFISLVEMLKREFLSKKKTCKTNSQQKRLVSNLLRLNL